MDEAVASEGNEVGLRIAPARERLRPLPRATEIEHRLAQGDHLAVGDPGEDRRNLVCRDGDHDLVEQRHAIGDPSLQDQRISAAEPREHRRVGIAEALGDLPRFDEARIHGVRVSLEQERQRGEHPQPRLLDAVAAARPPRAGRRGRPSPSPGPCRLGRTARAPARTHSVRRAPVRLGATTRGARHPGVFAIVVSPDHVSGNREALEILGVQLPLAMSRRQLGERVTPDATLERAAGSLGSIGHGHRFTI